MFDIAYFYWFIWLKNKLGKSTALLKKSRSLKVVQKLNKLNGKHALYI